MTKRNKKSRPLLARKISLARKNAGLSQKDLSHKLKISDKTVSSYEVGRAEPTIETLKKISEVTQHPLHYFVGNTSEQSQAEIKAKLNQIEIELGAIRALLKEQSERI